MAFLRSSRDGVSRPLLTRTLIGRSLSCGLRIADSTASGEHALLSFTGNTWELRDLGSKNGTFVDGTRLGPGSSVSVGAGSILGFGTKDGWELVDVTAPPLLAVDIATAEVHCAADGLLALPSEEQPEVSIYGAGGGAFVVESANGQVRRIREPELLTVGGRVFRLEPPLIQEGTPFAEEGPSCRNVTLRFTVSRNEEHVTLEFEHAGRVVELGRRDHFYVLLVLARIRLEDVDLPAEERGWVDRDELCRMVSLEPNALDVAIHRARKQLAQVGLEDAAGIVEVRAGQRRLATDRLQIA